MSRCMMRTFSLILSLESSRRYKLTSQVTKAGANVDSTVKIVPRKNLF